MHLDHLGSVIAVSNAQAVVTARYRFDPWGKQTQTLGNTDPTRRGFTGHEDIETLGLINMNGRVYDPVMARFVSVDPILQDPTNWQSYNGYSYLMNDPLMATDPSGYISFSKLISPLLRPLMKAIGPSASGVLSAVASAYAGVLCGPYCAAATSSYMSYNSTRAFGGGKHDALGGAALAGVQALVTYRIGDIGNSGYAAPVQLGVKALAHGVSGGVFADIRGGSFSSGFYSSVFSTLAAPAVEGIGGEDLLGISSRVAAAAAVGGTVSVIGGGKFGNGAITAAMVQALNDEQHRASRQVARQYRDAMEKAFLRAVANVNDAANAVRDLARPLTDNVSLELEAGATYGSGGSVSVGGAPSNPSEVAVAGKINAGLGCCASAKVKLDVIGKQDGYFIEGTITAIAGTGLEATYGYSSKGTGILGGYYLQLGWGMGAEMKAIMSSGYVGSQPSPFKRK
jgi:RHS repeat-associated protein